MQPVSVVATVLNEVQDIGRLVPSLLGQIPSPAEIVIVDGGSTDGTWEWLLDAARIHPNLLPIRDESCNLKRSPGPISRGRNVAIAAARSPIVACTDAGCTYLPDWLARITAPLVASTAQYALGGSCLDPADPTVWDLASAHFFGVKLSPSAPTKSCTARSMAFTKELWQRIGGFPESVFFGEDTLFDLEARRLTQPVFVERAKALYRPQYTFRSACRQLASYAISDGILGVRPARLFRNAARCIVQVLALLSLLWIGVPTDRSWSVGWWIGVPTDRSWSVGWWAFLPLLAVLALEAWFAFHPDWRFLGRSGPRTLLARLLFSVLVPWIVATNRIRGSLTRKNQPNRQNL
jgi:glycosyltransferase involved in cell wall biosynthesis